MPQNNGKPEIKALTVNLDETLPFLRSVSYSIVAQRTTQMVWRKDEGPMKWLYTAFLGAFGTPGTAEIESASDAEVAKQVEVETHHRIDVLMDKIEHGPVAVAGYLNKLHEVRESNLDALRGLYADQAEIDRDVAHAWGRAIKFVAKIKLGSTIAVDVLGEIPGPGWAVSLAYDIAVGTIDDLSDAGQANGVVVVASHNIKTECVKEMGKTIAEKGVEGVVDSVFKQSTEHELAHAFARMRHLENKLGHQANRLANGQRLIASGVRKAEVKNSVKSLSEQVARNAGKANTAEKQFLKAAGKRGLAKTVSWVFLAKGVMDAITKYNATVAAAGQ